MAKLQLRSPAYDIIVYDFSGNGNWGLGTGIGDWEEFSNAQYPMLCH